MSYMLSSQVYLDRHEYNHPYKNIIIINKMPPPGTPLAKIVRRVVNPPLSHFEKFDANRKHCIYALLSLDERKCNQLMEDTEVADLFAFLLENSYTIDTSLTKMMNKSRIQSSQNKLLCFILSSP